MNRLRKMRQYGGRRAGDIVENLRKNNLWKRVLKNTIATTAAVSIALIPGASKTIGKAAYLGAMTTVFGHPGRRFGQLAEALILTLSGALLGLAWSNLGVYLSSLIIASKPHAAYAIRGLFLTIALMVHGFLRSYAPRLFVAVVLLIIVSVVNLLSTAKEVTRAGVTQLLYPILIATGVILVVNLLVFPEFSSSFLGQRTIETLNDTAIALEKAGYYFTHSRSQGSEIEEVPSDIFQGQHAGHERGLTASNDQSDSATSRPRGTSVTVSLTNSALATKTPQTGVGTVSAPFPGGQISNKTTEASASIKIPLGDLTSAKGDLRKKLLDCKSAQSECNFEIAYAVLPPRDLKPISGKSMTKLLANVVAVISTCESKFALVGDFSEESTSGSQKDQKPEELDDKSDSSSLDPTRMDLEMVKPRREIEFGDVRLLHYLLTRIEKPYEDLITLPSGAKAPKLIILEDLDKEMSTLQQALQSFDSDTSSALEGAAIMQEMEGQEPDIMPREELFLISSFILNLRQAATHIQDMLRNARDLVEKKQRRRGRRRLYAPRIKWASWLLTGGDQDEALPVSGRKANRRGVSTAADMETAEVDLPDSKKDPLTYRKREDEENASHQTKIASEQTSTPAGPLKKTVEGPRSQRRKSPFIRQCRGQLADALEWFQESDDFLYASKLTIAVLLVSWPAWVPSWTLWYSLNRGLWAALQLVFVTEVSVGSSIWTLIVRGVGTTLGCIWGWAAWEARNGNPIVCVVMICLGVVPSAYVQLGTQHPKAGMFLVDVPEPVHGQFLIAGFPGTATENFLKRWIAFMIGGVLAIAVEMVLLPVKARTRMVESLADALRHVNEMENCIAAGIEEGKNFDVYNTDRVLRFEDASRNANGALGAAETFLTLFALHGALLTKLPLPQFLPSARLAHLRMINRVREVVQYSAYQSQDQENASKLVRQLAVRRKYMSWNAGSAAQAEVIEFLEELVDLTKLLVGANEFQSGLLTRPSFDQYEQRSKIDASKPITALDDEGLDGGAGGELGEIPSTGGTSNLRRRAVTKVSSSDGEDIPPSLKRIQSRKIEAGIRRQKTNDNWNVNTN
ncbi:MAG: hypothetical protein Q9195_001864 [Heterodermia aff. obscurata]